MILDSAHPFANGEPHRFVCDDCADTGLVPCGCGDRRNCYFGGLVLCECRKAITLPEKSE